MLSLIKLLKIVLPVTTVTAATIATVSLVSFQKLDNKLNKGTEDKVLEDFEKPIEEFKEQTMLYSENGQGENVTVTEEIQKQLEGKSPKENQSKGSDISDLHSENKAPQNSLKPSENATTKEKGELTSLNTENVDVSSMPSHSIPEPESSDTDSSSSNLLSESVKNISPKGFGNDEEKSKVVENTGSSSFDEGIKKGDIETSKENLTPNSKSDIAKEQGNSQAQDQDELKKGVSEDSGELGEPTKTIQDGMIDSPIITESGEKDGIQGEHGTNEIGEEQIRNMIKLEEDTLGALTSLKRLIN